MNHPHNPATPATGLDHGVSLASTWTPSARGVNEAIGNQKLAFEGDEPVGLVSMREQELAKARELGAHAFERGNFDTTPRSLCCCNMAHAQWHTKPTMLMKCFCGRTWIGAFEITAWPEASDADADSHA